MTEITLYYPNAHSRIIFERQATGPRTRQWVLTRQDTGGIDLDSVHVWWPGGLAWPPTSLWPIHTYCLPQKKVKTKHEHGADRHMLTLLQVFHSSLN